LILEIRLAQGDETALAAQISHDVWHETHAKLQDPAIAEIRTPLYFSDRVDDLAVKPLLAFVDDHPAAMASLDGEAVDQLFVLSPWRGIGVGRAMLGACEEVMAERGIKIGKVSCICGNAPARQFYERCNWTLTGLNPQSVESARGPVNVLHWEFHKQLVPAGHSVTSTGGSGSLG
jgi:GNAT superfamily N-acetyltransferase